MISCTTHRCPAHLVNPSDTSRRKHRRTQRRDAVVGSAVKKTLSGGERKRLNIGLDMIGMSDVYLFDEPTSGLSSKDSEHVIEIIRSMAHNKIIIVTIHQPSSKLFQMFHKAILLDKGGRLVFFGTPTDMLRYFAEAEHQHQFGAELGACPSCGTTRPEFIFDVLETPLRDLSGDIIYEENNRGQLVATRRYSPDFWRDKYEAFRLIQDVKQVSLRREPVVPLPAAPAQKKRLPFRWHDEWTQFRTLLRRSFVSKLRNRANLVITIGVAPVLALLIATILRYSDSGRYDFASAYQIGNYALEIRGMFWIDLGIMLMTAMGGVSLGLLISSLVADPKTAANIVPLVLIPQIIMGGAMIKYEDMNRNLALLYSLTHWFSEHPTREQNKKMESKLQVPFVCQFIAMRWSYEELIVAQAKLNPLTRRQDRANDEIQRLAPKVSTPEQRKRLDDLKETLAVLSGLEAKSASELDHYLGLLDQILDRKRPFDRALFKDAAGPVTAEQVYTNQKVSDLISNAEMEQSDYRRGSRPNVFFGAHKHYLGINVSVFVFNTIILIGSTLGLLVLLNWILRRQLEVRRS